LLRQPSTALLYCYCYTSVIAISVTVIIGIAGYRASLSSLSAVIAPYFHCHRLLLAIVAIAAICRYRRYRQPPRRWLSPAVVIAGYRAVIAVIAAIAGCRLSSHRYRQPKRLPPVTAISPLSALPLSLLSGWLLSVIAIATSLVIAGRHIAGYRRHSPVIAAIAGYFSAAIAPLHRRYRYRHYRVATLSPLLPLSAAIAPLSVTDILLLLLYC
jgi:hypothetical protein